MFNKLNAENFSRWQLRQGHDVILSESSFWYEASSHVFQAFPYHWVISPTEIRNQQVVSQKWNFSNSIFNPNFIPNWKNKLPRRPIPAILHR